MLLLRGLGRLLIVLESDLVLQDVGPGFNLSSVTQHPGFEPVYFQKWSLRLVARKYKTYVSQFPFLFFNLSGFRILLNHMSSQAVFSKDIYHDSVMIYDTKTISCTSRASYYARTNLLKTKRSSVDCFGEENTVKLLHYHTYANAFLFLKISRISSISAPQNIPYPCDFF